MSKRVGYYDKYNEQITRDEWEAKLQDESYWCIRKFDNGIVEVRLVWLGIVVDPQNTFSDCWKLFRLDVSNYDAEGVLRRDPVIDGDTFSNMTDAILAYEEFLEIWTESYREGDEFVEEENIYTPPPPPDLDSPMTETANVKLGIADDGIGAW